MMRFHIVGKKLFVTNSKPIRKDDLYYDSLVHPKLITFPLVMWGFIDHKCDTIVSQFGTTSPVKTSRRICLAIGWPF